MRNLIGDPDGHVYMNSTRPLLAGAGASGVASCFGDSCSLRSVTSGVSSSPSGFVSTGASSLDSGAGASDAATLRTPPAVAWKVFRGVEDVGTDDVEADGVGAGVGYE
jgi:hypothetical protein